MRLLVLIIIILLLALVWWPRHEPASIDDTFIGDEFKPLHKAQKFELKDYDEALEKHRKKLEDRMAADGG